VNPPEQEIRAALCGLKRNDFVNAQKQEAATFILA